LELRGAFQTHPERRRTDAEGAAPFDREPPQHLPQECTRAWRWIVERLPRVALYSTDEIAVEISARLLAKYWLAGELDALKELRQWLGKLGFTPQDRAQLPGVPPERRPNPFDALKSLDGEP
jgi:phage terminase small subunit